MAGANHSGDAEFARDDGGVAGAPAPVGDDGAGALHHRLPVRVGHVGHQHVARLHLVHLGNVVHQPHRTRANLLANGPPLDQHGAGALELVAQLGLSVRLALHRLGPRLQDVELAVGAVLAPLDVHRAAVVLLDDQRVARQLLDVGVGERIAVAQFGGHVGGLDQLAAGGLFLGRGEHHLDQLGTQVAPDQRALAGLQHGLVHVELVGVDGALHHGLTQAVAAGDEHHLVKAGFGVDGEHHARGPGVGAHHALHAGRQRHHVVREALVHAVADGAVVVEAGKHLLHLVQHGLNADHVEEGLLLAGERSIRQILRRGRRAHGKAGFRVAGDEFLESGSNGLLQVSRERLRLDPAADLGTGLGQRAHVLGVQRCQSLADALGQAAMSQELAERVRRGGKARGHAHALGQLRNHLAEAGILAADRLDIGHPELFERYDQGGRLE